MIKLTGFWASLTGQTPVRKESCRGSELAQELEKWRHKLAKYDDESPEFVLPDGLLVHIDKYAASIKSDQDLLNVCNRFH